MKIEGYISGYINYKGNTYTFLYENKKLNLIDIDEDKIDTLFTEGEYINFLESKTVTGWYISFFIDDILHRSLKTYCCFPKIVFTSRDDFFETKFDSIKFTGGVINRFYSNSQIIKNAADRVSIRKTIEFNDQEDVTKLEPIKIRNDNMNVQLSVSYPGFKYDGEYQYSDINSVLRVIHSSSGLYKSFVNDIIIFNNFFFFLMNRRKQNYATITLEQFDEKSNNYIDVVDLCVPNDDEQPYIPKFIINYKYLSTKINRLLKVISDLKYSTITIPKSDSDSRKIDFNSFSISFSAYQAVYNYCKSTKGIVYDHKEFRELKDEVCSILQQRANEYKGVSSKKRKYIKRFENIICKSQLEMEDLIHNGIDEFPFVLDTVDQDILKSFDSIDSFIEQTVEDRDKNIHNDAFLPSDEDCEMYKILTRLKYCYILKKSGVLKKNIQELVKHMSAMKII